MYNDYPTKNDPHEKLLVKIDKTPVRHRRFLHPLLNYYDGSVVPVPVFELLGCPTRLDDTVDDEVVVVVEVGVRALLFPGEIEV
jgi:hypothetical protein